MASFQFDLVSPERLLFSGLVDQVDVPGSEGDFGVLAGHAPLMTTLRPGILVLHREGGGAQGRRQRRLCRGQSRRPDRAGGHGVAGGRVRHGSAGRRDQGPPSRRSPTPKTGRRATSLPVVSTN